jgi:putative oxidoreductase
MGHLYLLLGRAALAFLLILSGFGRLAHYAAAQQSLEAVGVSASLLPLLVLLEVGGGVAVLAGAFTRVVAGALALLSLAAGLWFYGDFTDQNQFIQLSKHTAMAGGFLMLVATGGGAFSIDAWRHPPRPQVTEDCVIC